MKNYHDLVALLQKNESRLMTRILHYAIAYGYSQYTSTLTEAWRLSISGLTGAIARYVASNPVDAPVIDVHSNYKDDAIAGFGVIEAQRHRSRGIDLGMFLGLFKYYRDAYLDLIRDEITSGELAECYSKYLLRCFDRFELAFCIEWATKSEDAKLTELQTTNICLANEKNKYLTLFESFWNPIVVLNSANEIDNINMAGIQLLEQTSTTGYFHYNDESASGLLDEKSINTRNCKNKHVLDVFPCLEKSLPAFDTYNATYNTFVTKIFNSSNEKEDDYSVTIFPMRDLSKKFTGKIIFFENITDKILVEKQLRESEEKYRTLVETMNEGILVINKDHFVTYINQKICALLGRSRDEIIGRNFENFLHPDSKHDFVRQQLLRKEGYSDSYEFILVNKDGEKVFVLSSPTPLIDERLNYNGSYEVITNISNLKLIEHQLIHSQKMETIGVMAAGLAHEINTPLQYAIGNSTFVKETIDKLVQFITSIRDLMHDMAPAKLAANPRAIDDIIDAFDVDFITKEIPPAINECLEGLNRIAAIVLSVKKFAHPDSDEFRPINVNEEITTTINISRNEWKYVADMECRFDENLPPLSCIASDFNQVILNLIINASHAVQEKYNETAQKGTIRITTSMDKHDLVVSVSDNGTGIPVRVQNKIFNPFFTTKDVGKGTGMGLAIVLKIIEKHKGKIWFESEEGKGTTFHVRFPLGND